MALASRVSTIPGAGDDQQLKKYVAAGKTRQTDSRTVRENAKQSMTSLAWRILAFQT